MTSTALLEPSFADLIAAIEQAGDLPDTTATLGLLRAATGQMVGSPGGGDSARWNAIRLSVRQLHHVRVGVTPKTRSNHRSNRAGGAARSAMSTGAADGARLTLEWARSVTAWSDDTRPPNFIRYCSARGINPSSVNDTIFQDYWTYRAEFTGMASGNATRRPMVRPWKTCVTAREGWSPQQLAEPP